METNNLFDAIGYFKGAAAKNKLAKSNGFYPCSCSGINTLEEVLAKFKKESAFISVDDTNDGVTERRSGGFFKKRTFTVFIMKKYKYGDMNSRQASMDICRELSRQIHSRMLKDRENMGSKFIYLNTDNVYSRELGEYFINGCTGVYFMVDVSEPINLIYNAEEWDE